ncbi:hypothetical protein CO665_30965 [Rhizobium anhuiense]|uniref:hypothetical protein n=1 Tax=Rhizobium anhuiense TaxID=1184720 RepID=UPI000BEACCA9|nr:hypothetical protein [Rhizobium anhuiense]PDS34454.1 hypothetical protein CO665_30965 [Rhizobium anhuiense]
MAYDLHITRKENWFAPTPGFTLQDWLGYVDSDPELKHDGFAEATVADGKVLRIEQHGLCVWAAYSGGKTGNGVCWLSWNQSGSIDAKNPDQEIRQKMWSIAQRLGAKVQGDDGELYGPDGNQIVEIASTATISKRAWWRFW